MMKPTWQSIGQRVRDELIARDEKISAEISARIARIYDLEAMANDQRSVMERYCDYLIDLRLRSQASLDSAEREWCAQLLEEARNAGAFQLRARRGAPKDTALRESTAWARHLYAKWKEANKEAGIVSHGNSSRMKDEAAGYAAMHFELGEHRLESIRALMDNPDRLWRKHKP